MSDVRSLLDQAGAFTGVNPWAGLNMNALAKALASKAPGSGGSNLHQVFESAGDPTGRVYVPNDRNAICLDTVNQAVWYKFDGKIGNGGWSRAVLVSNGDPVIYSGSILGLPANDTEYHLEIDQTPGVVGSLTGVNPSTGLWETRLSWTYPITGGLGNNGTQPTVGPLTVLGIFLQRSPDQTNVPPGVVGSPLQFLYTVNRSVPAADGDWATIFTWGFGTHPLPLSYIDNTPLNSQNPTYNYRLIMIMTVP